jgi:uncharacterized membrane protein YfcA
MPLDLSVSQAVIMAAAVLVAAYVRGYSGFGFSALVVASASLVTDPRNIIPVVFFCELAMTTLQARGIWRLIQWSKVLTMLAGAAVAMIFAVALLARIGLDTARMAISGVILALAVLLLTGWTFRRPVGVVGHVAVGCISGICNGAAVGGLPVAAFLTANSLSAPVFRATMIAYLTVIDIVALPLFAHEGLISRDTILAALATLPLLAIGLTLGGRHFIAASPQTFRYMAISLLAVLACLGLIRSVF